MIAGVLIVLVPGVMVFVGTTVYSLVMERHANSADTVEANDPSSVSGTDSTVAVGSKQPASEDTNTVADTSLIQESPAVLPDRMDVIKGDRVAWLDDSGNGYARTGNGWLYHGPAGNVPYHSGSGTLEFALVETMRTKEFVELYDAGSRTRVRLRTSQAVASSMDSASSGHRWRDGSWRSSNEDASWLAAVDQPDVQVMPPVEISDTASLQELIAVIEPNVVRVDVTTEFGSGNGSGFLADASGRIVTNYHVVEGCQSATVVFKGDDSQDSIRLDVEGFLHLDSKRDIAVLQVTLPRGFGRPGLRVAEQLPSKGASVVAFGAPLGLDFSATEGIVSGIRSTAELEERIGLENHDGRWIQTTAAISPGNSGGPLVDRHGQVVGINTMTLTIGQQLNFSLCADDIRHVLGQGSLYARKLTPKSAPLRIAQDLGTPEELPGGYSVYAIEKTAKARLYLRELEEVQLVILAGQYRRGVDPIMEGLMRDFVRQALGPNDVRIVIDEGPVLLLLAIVTSSGDLNLVAHLFVDDKSAPNRELRIWRHADDMGRLTKEMKRRKRFLGRPLENIQGFFRKLHDALAEAKADVKFDDADESDDDGTVPDP